MYRKRVPPTHSGPLLSPGDIAAMTKRDDELVTAWLRTQQAQGFSNRTVTRRDTAMKSYRRHIAPLSLRSSSAEVVEDWLLSYTSPATRHAYRSDLSLFYKWALLRKLIPEDPMASLPATKVPRGVPRPFSQAVIDRLLAAPLDPTYGLMIRLGLYAGLRVSEMAALCWEDIRLSEGGTLTVRDGKGGKSRILPMHPNLIAALPSPRPYGPVLLCADGTPFDGGKVGRTIKAVLTLLGIDGVPHQLRHCYGTELARASGGDMLLVATLMGHSSPATTMIYAQLAGGEASRIVDLMWVA